MKATLLDTGVIVALLDRRERYHARCVAAIDDVMGPLVTCEPVIAEACHLMRRVRGAPEAILENVRAGVFQIPFTLAEHAEPVSRVVTKYRDVPADLADACLVHLAEMVSSSAILTLDRDFAVYRWGGRKRFDLLVDLA